MEYGIYEHTSPENLLFITNYFMMTHCQMKDITDTVNDVCNVLHDAL